MKRLGALLFLFTISACGTSGMSSGGGAGANAGGAQDIGLARTKIEQGQVPAAADFPVEGLYAEHDLPLAGAACAETLCLRLGEGLAPHLGDATPRGFVQVGLSSNVDLATFHRSPLSLAVVIDHSGSMGTTKMEAVKDAVHKLIDQLDERDVLSVIEFDQSANRLIGPEAVTDRERFHAQVRRIASAGSTCIECGMKLGYESARAKVGDGRVGRVMLLTDAQPNVGGTAPGDFLPMVHAAAEEGIGLTAFGVGLDFGQDLVLALSAERSANYVYLSDEARMRTAFDEDFDFLVTPIAYDLKLEARTAAGVTREGVYGIPGSADGKTAGLEVKSVFLSKRKSAITLSFSGVTAGQAIGDVQLDWTDLEGAAHHGTLAATAPLGAAPSFSEPTVRKAFALTEMALRAKEVCEAHAAGNREKASTMADALAAFLDAEAKALADDALGREATLMAKLATLVK